MLQNRIQYIENAGTTRFKINKPADTNQPWRHLRKFLPRPSRSSRTPCPGFRAICLLSMACSFYFCLFSSSSSSVKISWLLQYWFTVNNHHSSFAKIWRKDIRWLSQSHPLHEIRKRTPQHSNSYESLTKM